MWLKISFSPFWLVILALVSLSLAQNSPQDYVNVHNTARSAVSVGPIVWNNTLANYALNYANTHISDCNLVHSRGPYSENLAKGYGMFFTGIAAMNLWISEKKYYVYATNSCVRGQQCLHYTQVVWKNSTNLGCARVQCVNGWYWIICSYNPPGNYIGQCPY